MHTNSISFDNLSITIKIVIIKIVTNRFPVVELPCKKFEEVGQELSRRLPILRSEIFQQRIMSGFFWAVKVSIARGTINGMGPPIVHIKGR
jgi:hypothetical protein